MMILVKAIGFITCASLALVALVSKISEIHHKRQDPAFLALLNAFALCAMAFTMAALQLVDYVDQWLGVPDITALMAHVLALAWNTAALVVIILWSKGPDKARLRIRAWLVAVSLITAVEIILFTVAVTGSESKNFWINNATQPVGAVYIALYLLVLEVTRLAIFLLCWRYYGAATDPWLRRGLRTAALGSAILLIYGPARGVTLLPIQIDRVAWETGLTLCMTSGMFLLLLGLITPTWGSYLSDFRQWIRDINSYRALYPLWSDICRAVPDVVLHPPASSLRDELILWDVNYRLYRRAIEIRDGWLALRSYLNPQITLGAIEQSEDFDEDLQVAVDVTRITSALKEYAKGEAIGYDPGNGVARLRDTEDFVDEIDWLVRLAKAYARSS
jgi:hypothetical protein